MYVPPNAKKIQVAYKSKHNLTFEQQVVLLMISTGENWHYLVVKNLSGLLRGITLNHKEGFSCLNCFCVLKRFIKLSNLIKKHG